VETKKGRIRRCEVLGDHRRESERCWLVVGYCSAVTRMAGVGLLRRIAAGVRHIVHSDELLTANFGRLATFPDFAAKKNTLRC